MRAVIGLVIVLIVAAVLAPVVYYGTTDPCRMLAQEMAADAYKPMAKTLGGDPNDVPDSVERPMRLITSQMSGRECSEKLWDRWFGSGGNS